MFRKYLSILHNNGIIRHYLGSRNVANNVNYIREKQLQKQILQKYLDISYQRSANLFRNKPYLQTIDNKQLESTVKTLRNMGIESNDIYQFPMTLTLHYNTIEHNIKYLEEAGFTYSSAQILLKFRSIVKKPISLLKAHGIITENTNVPNRLYSYLFPKPEEFPILKKFTDEDSIVYIHETIFKHYLVWRLQTTMQEIERVFGIYDKFKYKSFDLTSQMIQILTEDLYFSNAKLLQNGFLFQNAPVYIRQIMSSFPTLAGVDIKTVLYKFPKIIATTPDNISAIDKYLRDFGITEDAIKRCFNIYTLAPDTILYRLSELKKVPEFEVLIKNSRIVRLILSQNKAKSRLAHLQKLKVKCASINILCASDTVFEKYVQEGNDKTKGSDIINFISQELSIPETDVRRQLSNNPHWCHVPLIALKDTLNYVIDNLCPKSDIAHMPIILLYPKNQVRNALLEIDNNPDLSNLEIDPRIRLNLCLYFIEKKHHFSGDGIWDSTSLDAVATSN